MNSLELLTLSSVVWGKFHPGRDLALFGQWPISAAGPSLPGKDKPVHWGGKIKPKGDAWRPRTTTQNFVSKVAKDRYLKSSRKLSSRTSIHKFCFIYNPTVGCGGRK